LYSKYISIEDSRKFIDALGKSTDHNVANSWFIEQRGWDTIFKSQPDIKKKHYLLSRIWYGDSHMFHLMNYIPYNQYKNVYTELSLTEWSPSEVDRSDTIMGYTGRKTNDGGETLIRHIGWESYEF